MVVECSSGAWERRLLGDSVFAKECNFSKDMAKSAWQNWLDQWEEKQQDNLKHYQEATKELVDALRKDLLEKLGEAQPHVRRSAHFPAAKLVVTCKSDEEANAPVEAKASMADPSSARERELSPASARSIRHSRGGVSGVPAEHRESLGRDSEYNCTYASERSNVTNAWRAVKSMKSVKPMNDAMTEVLGVGKYMRSCTRSTQQTGWTKQSPEQKQDDGTPNFFRAAMMTYDDMDDVFTPACECQRLLHNAVHSHWFNVISGLLIAIYAVIIGVTADLEMRAAMRLTPGPEWREYFDVTFTCWCVLEFCLRFAAEGVYYFKGSERNWNFFDMMVAVMGVLDLFLSEIQSFTFLRVLRTVRAMRLLRVMRLLAIFKELRLMMASILCCLVPLASAFALLVIVIYVFAVMLLQGAAEYVRTEIGSDYFRQVVANNFPGMGMTIYSLTQAVSGGKSWADLADPFLEIAPWYGLAFGGFVIFVIFGVLNILTGVFVEATARLANVDKELVIQEQMARDESVVGQMRNLFREIDDNGSGTITQAELMRNLKDDRVRAYFQVLEMDVSEAHGLFELLDRDESGEVSIDEFIMTCMRLKGTARSLDMAAMLFENKRLYKSLKAFMEGVEGAMTTIEHRLDQLSGQASRDYPMS